MEARRYAIVPAAGRGARFGDARPKQYVELAGRSMLEHALQPLVRHDAIACVYVVLAPGDSFFAASRLDAIAERTIPLYCGGPTRAGSVFNALVALRDRIEPHDWILVHDAARPCLARRELDRLLAELETDPVGGLLALPVADTLKRADRDRRAIATEPRTALWRALTPQMFRYHPLVEALHRARALEPTDEAAAIEALGLKPRLVQGASSNIKVTFPEDLPVAQAILATLAEERCA